MKGGTILGYTYRPKEGSDGDPESKYPLLVNYHGAFPPSSKVRTSDSAAIGGGFFLGSAVMDHPLCCTLSAEHGLTVLNVEYRLAPENQFPGLVDDAYEALKWVGIPDIANNPGFLMIPSLTNRLSNMRMK